MGKVIKYSVYYSDTDGLYGTTESIGEAAGWAISLLLSGKELRISIEN
jgi:hypothetical protein